MSWCCLICRDKIFVKSHEISVLPCGHTFHSKCENHWFTQSKTCAVCRTSIRLNNIIRLYPSTEDYECQSNDTDDIECYVFEQRAEINKKVEEVVKLQKTVDDLLKHNTELEIKVSQLDTQIKDLKNSNKILNTGIRETQQTADKTKVLYQKLEAKHQALQKEADNLKFISQAIGNCTQDVDNLIQSEVEKLSSSNPKDIVSRFAVVILLLQKELNRQQKLNVDLRKESRLLLRDKVTAHQKLKKYQVMCEIYKNKLSECSKMTSIKSTSKEVSITEDCSAININKSIQKNDCSFKLNFQSEHKKLNTVIIDNLNTPSTFVQSSVITLPNSTSSRNLSSSISRVGYNGLGGHETVIQSSKTNSVTEENCKRELDKNDIIRKRMKTLKK